MNASQHPNSNRVPGPSDALDLHIAPMYFDQVGTLIHQYGDFCRIPPDKRKHNSYLVNNADYIKQILLSNSNNYVKGVGFERVKLLLGNGIIVSDGDFWRRQRRMIQPAFHKSNIEHMSAQMLKCNQTLFKQWRKLADTGEPIDLSTTVSELALDIILGALFGADLDQLVNEQGENPFLFFVEDSSRNLQVALKFHALRKRIDALIEQRRRENRIEDDLLAALMNARDKESGAQMNNEEIIDEVMTLIVAGHETSAGTLNWVWFLLSQHVDIEQQLHLELHQQLNKQTPGFEHTSQLNFTRQIIEETLRLYPPVWMYTRKALQEDKLGEYKIEAGANIFISPYYLHRNEQYWPNAEQFLPQRFTAQEVKARHRFAYLPFSAGPRRCIGDIFGIVEMQLHIALMAQFFRLRLVPDQKIELDAAVNLRSKYPIKMTIESR